MRTCGIVGLLLVVAVTGTATAQKSMKDDLTFLTREGCVNTPDMQLNLDDALTALGWALDYRFIDIGTLPTGDVRTGYPTPTVLYKGRDLFGMPKPKPPFNAPS